MLTLTSRPHRTMLLPLALAALLSAMALSAAAAFVAPGTALGASTFTAKCDANLRTKPSSSSTKKAEMAGGGQMYAVNVVSGGRWSLVCGGRSYSGTSWYKISNVNAGHCEYTQHYYYTIVFTGDEFEGTYSLFRTNLEGQCLLPTLAPCGEEGTFTGTRCSACSGCAG